VFIALARIFRRRIESGEVKNQAALVKEFNLVFSAWDRIFKNPMATASAIDRLVHHSVILEFADVESHRGRKQKVDGKTEEDAESKPRKKLGHARDHRRAEATP
jgi:hypothetical protein